MIQLAIVGVGWAGSRHITAIGELGEKVQVSCLVDNDADFLREKSSEFAVEKTFADLDEALADPDVDAVDICSPHHLHCEQAIAAAEAGKHVLVEKPMAQTVEEATRMIDAAQKNAVKLYVAESAVYTPMAQTLREIVQSGKYIGEVVSASFAGGFRAPNFGYPGRREWLTLPDAGGTGTWTLHGIHSMAQLRFILGEVESVYMREFHAQSFERSDLEGTMSGMLAMEKGFQTLVVQTCEVSLKDTLGGYEIRGDAGVIKANAQAFHVFPAQDKPFSHQYPPSSLSEYALELAAFADYVVDGQAGPTDAVSERRSLAIVQAGYESAENGLPVNLKERFGDL